MGVILKGGQKEKDACKGKSVFFFLNVNRLSYFKLIEAGQDKDMDKGKKEKERRLRRILKVRDDEISFTEYLQVCHQTGKMPPKNDLNAFVNRLTAGTRIKCFLGLLVSFKGGLIRPKYRYFFFELQKIKTGYLSRFKEVL
ncbi:MAG: hypothetical protein HQK89_16930 [Nitrospirae bacterium]|nr:hypothetical protein [Nitrospirota bacterium]